MVEEAYSTYLMAMFTGKKSEQQNGKDIKCPLPIHWSTDPLIQSTSKGGLEVSQQQQMHLRCILCEVTT